MTSYKKFIDEPKPNEIIISDDVCKQGLKSTWGSLQQLILCASSQIPQESFKQNIFLHEISWGNEISSPAVRKLINEFRNIFVLLQKKSQETHGSDFANYLLRASGSYRAVLKACSLSLSSSYEMMYDKGEKLECEYHFKIWELIDQIWNLCEILFLREATNELIITHLLDWYSCVVPEPNLSELSQYDVPGFHPKFWTMIYSLILRGNIESARRVLSQHQNHQSQAFVIMDRLLMKMPLPLLYRGHMTWEIDRKWQQWQKNIKAHLDDGDFTHEPHLKTLSRILIGDDEVFRELKEECGSWCLMLISRLLYQRPTVPKHELQDYIQICMNCYPQSKQRELDNIFKAIFEFDILQVIKECSSHFGNWWFVAHITDILQHRAIPGIQLREYFLLDYASTLMAHKSLWTIGVDYLDYCTEFGKKYLELLIERIHLNSDKKALKVIHVCQKRGLVDLVGSVCKIMVRKYLSSGQLGSALTWSLKSKDTGLTTIVAEKFLEVYMTSGQFTNLDLLDNLGPEVLVSKKLTFFGKYREFHRLYNEGRFEEAATLLISLLVSRLIPPEFTVTVFTDALPLLETETPVFSSSQTYELMYCLENLKLSRQFSLLSSKQDSEDEAKQLQLLSLGLARNLSRSIMEESSLKL